MYDLRQVPNSHRSNHERNKQNDLDVRMLVDRDSHPPSEFRGNGIVKNFDEFHTVFKTKPGDAMYLAPAKRVKMWSAK